MNEAGTGENWPTSQITAGDETGSLGTAASSSEVTLPHCHFVHCKSHMDCPAIDPKPPRR
jgi:hypothetical protein